MKYFSYLLLIATIGFHLVLNFSETKILADPNDNIFQYSLVDRTNWVWSQYHCPFSFQCLANLVDHNVPTWVEGYPLPFYYSHIPQIALVSSYHLLIAPIVSIFSSDFSLYIYYNWTKYLLLSFLPLSFFIALRIAGFNPILSVMGAFLGSHFSTDGLYGIDQPSYLWRGYGLTSQLYAIFFFPLAIASTYRALRDESENHKKKYTLLAAVFLTLTTAGHLGLGIMGFLSTIPFLFFDRVRTHIFLRMKKIFLICAIPLLLLSYWIIPVLLYNNYHMISFWDPLWKFNSYGWYEVIKQIWAGELFDWLRPFPIITTLVVIGFFATALKKEKFPIALLFAFWTLLYFGRTTWGGLIDLIPGMKDFHQHRFLVGVQIAGIFLIPEAILFLSKTIRNGFHFLRDAYAKTHKNTISLSNLHIIYYILIILSASIIAYLTVLQTISYASLNNRWINEANIAYKYDEKNFKNLLSYLSKLPDYRIYAGRPGNWGHDFRLGSTQMYMLFGVNGKNMSQFLPETWSPLSENEQNFDERTPEDYDLLNIGYVVAPKNQGFPKEVVLEKKFGPFELYKAPTSGWFDVVTSPMIVRTDKTNFLNIVHLWHRSFSRRWKMNPIISLEKNPKMPFAMERSIEMIDEVNYTENGLTGNIFADFPLTFPESTPSGRISSEKVSGQSYKATIDVSSNCKFCMIMFKQSFHPDWSATVDGKKADIYAVFPFYLATPVTGGVHTVEFHYSPNRLKVALLVLEIVLIFGAIFYIFFHRKNHV